MNTDNVLLAISQETDTNRLSQMLNAIQDRKRALARLQASSIKVGDTVKFADSIRPTYLRGLTATVVGLNRESVSVKCPADLHYGRFSGSGRVRLPLSLIAS